MSHRFAQPSILLSDRLCSLNALPQIDLRHEQLRRDSQGDRLSWMSETAGEEARVLDRRLRGV